jgi:hypothetical protein
MSAQRSLVVVGVASVALLAACDGEARQDRVAAPLEVACLAPEAPVAPGSWVCGTSRVQECDVSAGSHPGAIHVLPATPPDGGAPAACSVDGVRASQTGPFAPGVHSISVSSVGPDGVQWCTSRLTVQDTLAPAVVARRLELWPPNHTMHVFTPYDCLAIVDACDPSTVAAFTWASSDEPDDANGDGHTSADIELNAGRVQLRAERAGGGDGRVYTLGWVVADASGNYAKGICEIAVPHDQGKGQAVVGPAVSTEFVADPFLVAGAEVRVRLADGLPVVSVEAFKQ